MTSEYEQLAQRLARIERKLMGNAGSRLSNASIENSTIPTYDETGQVQAYIGRQYDGAFGVLDVAGPTPPTPTGFNVEVKPGALLVEWLGEWENDEVAPSNFQRVEFHASEDPNLSGLLRTTLKNTLTTPRGETVRIDLPYESVQYIRMVARTSSGKVSAASPVMGPYTIPRLTPEDVQIDLDAIGGNTISKGDTAPAGPNKIGDLWLQTPNNIAYRWEGTPGAWVASRDQGIVQALNDAFQANQAASQAGIDALAAQSTAGTAQGTANTALSTANSKTTTFSQPGQPPTTGRVTGDEWIDTDDGNKRYYWNGSAWTAGTLGAAAIAATARELGALTTFKQTTAPTTGMVAGDFWLDSDDGNKIYRYSGSAWELSRDPDIGNALTAASTAQATADGKVRIFAQTAAPTGLVAGDVGDMWIDTDDANKTYTWDGAAWVPRLFGAAAISATARQLGAITTFKQSAAPTTGMITGDFWVDSDDSKTYRYSGSAWELVQDAAIQTALTDASTAKALADGKMKIYVQTAAPTGLLATDDGDMWIDTDDGNKTYTWNGTTLAWVARTWGASAISATARQLGAITTFRQTTAPTTGMIDGDFWIDSDDGNKVYIRASGAWVLSRDPDINVAITNAATAQAVADGKMRIFPQPDAPTGLTAGDLGDMWIDTDDANKTWTWDGTAWVPRLIGNAAIQPQSLVASDVIATGTVTAALLEAVLVLVSKIIVGDPLAEHIEIEDDISFISLDPDGVPYVAQRFGKSSAGTDASGNVIWQIDEGGYASVQDLSSTNEPVFAGLPLSDWVSGSATFHAGGSRGNQTDPANSAAAGELGYYEVTMEMDNLHQYLIQTSNLWIRRQSGAGTNRIDLNIRYTVSTDPAVDPPPVTTSSPLFARNSQPLSNDLGGQFQITKLFRPATPYAHFRFLLSVGYFAGGGYIEMGSANTTDATLGQVMEVDTAQLYAINLGAVQWTNRAVTNAGGTPAPGAAPAPVKRYTYTYTPLWTRRFRGDNTVHSDGGDAVQGQTPYYTSNGNQKTQIGDFRRSNATVGLVADLQGATIEKFEVYLYAKAWHFNSGGTAVIKYHNNTGPTTYINVAGQALVGGWAVGQGRWVDLTSWGNIFRDGGAKGIEVGPGVDTNPIYYGTFHGHTGSHPPAIRVTYTK